MKLNKILGSALAAVFVAPLYAYETGTHDLLSQQAALQSNIYADTSLFSDLGIGSPSVSTFAATDGVARNASGIVGFGAVAEDDIDYLARFIRPYNHFFDPQYSNGIGRGLDAYSGFIRGQPSPDWALEDHGDVTTLAATLNYGGFAQNFSYKHAQEHYYAALTGQTASTRQQEFSLLFQTLGQIIHHIQDMAQPQHTRNDTHRSDRFSLFERYTLKYIDNSRLVTLLQQNPYPIPSFSTARQYWHTVGSGSSYVGMAEFTSRNFVSLGSTFRSTVGSGGQEIVLANPEFPLPNGTNTDGTQKSIAKVEVQVRNFDGSQYNGSMWAVLGDVYDGFRGIHYPGRLLLREARIDIAAVIIGV